MSNPISLPEVRVSVYEERSQEEMEARACLPQAPAPEALAHVRDLAVARLIETLVSAPLPAAPPAAKASGAGETARQCGPHLMQTVLTCGVALLSAPPTLGASLLAMLPCAAQSAALGKCIADEQTQTEVASARRHAAHECRERGGIAFETPEVLTCVVSRSR